MRMRLPDDWGACARWVSSLPPRAVFLGGLAAAVAWTLYDSYVYVPLSPEFAAREMSIRQDWRNLYDASLAASWRDIPKWFVGPWNYPGVGYYRPLTSILFLAEVHAFGENFQAYNVVTWLLTALNAGLLYALAWRLFGSRALGRLLCAGTAVYYFAPTGSSMEIAHMGTLQWWPAQNDVLCSLFLLAGLLFLERWTVAPQKRWFWRAVGAFAAAIGSKEMGHVALPLALGLLAVRGKLSIRTGAPFLALGVFLFYFRRLVVPNPWEPALFSYRALGKALNYWAHPVVWLGWNDIWWPVVAGLLVVAILIVAVARRWRAAPVAAACGAIVLGCAQWVPQDGGSTYALALDWQQFSLFAGVLAYAGALALFIRFRREEPALFAAWALMTSIVPMLGYAGRHYFYFPSICAALANAAFSACLLRLAASLFPRPGASSCG